MAKLLFETNMIGKYLLYDTINVRTVKSVLTTIVSYNNYICREFGLKWN